MKLVIVGGVAAGMSAASQARRIDTAAAAIHTGMTALQVHDLDLAYAPPFGPSWSPLLVAASQLIKALG